MVSAIFTLIKMLDPDYLPIYQPSFKKQKVLKFWIEENFKKGFIKQSKSAYGAPIFFVGKSDGEICLVSILGR
jgi:hypothetical protein